MLDVVTLFLYFFHQPYLRGFYLKHFTLVSTVFVHNEIVFCNSKHENGSRVTLRETGIREGLKVKEFGGEEKLSLDNT